jgi:alpha-galactosidase
MWCMFSAPLMIGCDISNMNESTKTILMNKEIIAIDQDSLGMQAIRVMRKDCLDAWKKPLSNNRFAIAFLNRNSEDMTVTASWKDLELNPNGKYNIYDVWQHKAVSHPEETISAKLRPHECQVFIFSPTGFERVSR